MSNKKIKYLDIAKPLAAFLTVPGYYLIMMFFFKAGLAAYSRYFTVPLRLFLMGIFILFLFILKPNKSAILKDKIILFTFYSFWSVYLLRMIYDVYCTDIPLSISRGDYPLYTLGFGLFPVFFFAIPSSKKSYDWSKYVLVYGSCILSILSFILYKDMFIHGQGRLAGYEVKSESTLSPHAASYISVYSLTFGLINIVLNRGNIYLNLAIVISSIPGILMGGSRGAMVAMATSFLFIMVAKKRFVYPAVTIFIVSLSLPIIGQYSKNFGSSLFIRIDKTVNDIKEDDLEEIDRIKLWVNAINNFKHSPLWGDFIENRGIGHHPHNIIIEAFMAAGLLGGIPFLIIIIFSFRMAYTLSSSDKEIDWLTILFIQAFTQNMFTGAIWGASWLWCSIGLMMPLYKNAKKNKHSIWPDLTYNKKMVNNRKVYTL